MKKYIIVKTGEECKIGDLIGYSIEKKCSFGEFKLEEYITLNSSNLQSLIDKGVIKCVEPSENKERTLAFYIDNIAKKLGCTSVEVTNKLDKLNKVCPKAVFDILLAEISLQDFKDDCKKYLESSSFYSINPANGKIFLVTEEFYGVFPLFKDEESAKAAKKLLKKQLCTMGAIDKKDV